MKYELTLDNMSCGHCVMAVKEALAEIEGLTADSVEIGRAQVEAANYKNIAKEVAEALEEEGYPVTSVEAL